MVEIAGITLTIAHLLAIVVFFGVLGALFWMLFFGPLKHITGGLHVSLPKRGPKKAKNPAFSQPVSGGGNRENIMGTIQELLSKHHPESDILRTLSDLGIDETAGKKMILLAQSNALDSFKKEIQDMSKKNVEEQMKKIEAKMGSMASQQDLYQKIQELDTALHARKAVADSQISKEQLVETVIELLDQHYTDAQILPMFADLGIGELAAKAVIAEAKIAHSAMKNASVQEEYPQSTPPAKKEEAPKDKGPEQAPAGKSAAPASPATPPQKAPSPEDPLNAQSERINHMILDIEERLEDKIKTLASATAGHDQRFVDAVERLNQELVYLRRQMERHSMYLSQDDDSALKLMRIREITERLRDLQGAGATVDPRTIDDILRAIREAERAVNSQGHALPGAYKGS